MVVVNRPRTVPNRAGRIRNLCFKRLSELVLQFASSYDFTGLSRELWTVVQPALQNLPVSVIYAEKSPSLLRLLVSLSSHPKLIPLLCEQVASVETVFKCISETSKFSVIDSETRSLSKLGDFSA